MEYKEIDPNNVELPEEYKEFNKNFEEEENEHQSDNIKENGNEKDKENNKLLGTKIWVEDTRTQNASSDAIIIC